MTDSILAHFPEIQTDRLTLRETKPQDAQALFEILSEERITRYYNIGPLTSIEQARELIKYRRRSFQSGQRIRWAITTKDDSLLIGSAGYVDLNNNAHRAEIGYELGEKHHGQGYMTEALKGIIEFGFTHLSLNRIEALVVPENMPSIKLLQKLAFHEEGLLRKRGYWKNEFHDLKIYSLLHAEFAELGQP